MYSFANLKEGINTYSGIAEKVLIAPVEWFTEAGIKSPGVWAQKGDEVIIYDDHIFLPGKAFIECRLAPEKNDYKAKSFGDKGFTKFANEITALVPGSYALLHEFFYNIIGKAVIVLIKDANCPLNMWYQVGSDCVAARVSASFETGTTKDGIKGYTATITNTAEKVLLYAGEITVLDEVVIPSGGIKTEDGFNFITEDDQTIIAEN